MPDTYQTEAADKIMEAVRESLLDEYNWDAVDKFLEDQNIAGWADDQVNEMEATLTPEKN